VKKWFASILLFITLIFITLTGTFFPCCPVDYCSGDELLTSTSGNEERKQDGACSPFFSCSACMVSVELAEPVQLPEPFFQNQIQYAEMHSINLSTYSANFWQPPRHC
jgi:hypothetical protein